MAIERKTVTKAPEQHPFERMGTEKEPAAPERTSTPATTPAQRTEPSTRTATPQKRETRAKRPPQGRGVVPANGEAAPKDPLITRTYRIPQSLDERMQAASLRLGVDRGRVVNKTDVVREGVEKLLDELGL